ncbi:MAG: hypothetical protein SAJ12_04050 [Jaaginema sp. PMC 1079.18]|nr:hypothetical protein [Jaaginema sp. PMC 1080.18]MEC4850161.1 hypothetical protein [Jaaginema sp. PMC 1079.18]
MIPPFSSQFWDRGFVTKLSNLGIARSRLDPHLKPRKSKLFGHLANNLTRPRPSRIKSLLLPKIGNIATGQNPLGSSRPAATRPAQRQDSYEITPT